MKIKIDLTAADLRDLNDPETASVIIAEAHDIVSRIFDEKDNLPSVSVYDTWKHLVLISFLTSMPLTSTPTSLKLFIAIIPWGSSPQTP